MTTRVVGIGSEGCGDDAAGRLVARRLRGRVPEGVEVLECDGETTQLLDLLAGADHVILVDAAQDEREPGTVRRVAPGQVRLRSRASTHRLGVTEALGLAAALDRLPPRLSLYAISGARFEPGDATPAVAKAVGAVARRILAELARHGAEPDGQRRRAG